MLRRKWQINQRLPGFPNRDRYLNLFVFVRGQIKRGKLLPAFRIFWLPANRVGWTNFLCEPTLVALIEIGYLQRLHLNSHWLNLIIKQAVRRIQVRIDRAEDGNFGDCEPVGEGVSEMRIHYGPGYRVYFVQRGIEIVILLAGGNKSTQSKDIKTALEIARQI